MYNIPESISAKLGRRNHLRPNHPVEIVKRMIWEHFGSEFPTYEHLDPHVSTWDNFDALRVPEDHPSRAPTDTYYMSEDLVLRTHTTAHMTPLIKQGVDRYLVCGDVYRKDTIDASHYPVFTQIDGFCVLDNDADVPEELKRTLGGLIEALFPGAEYRFSSDYFPFTIDSIEAEVLWNGQWLEILGGGTTHPEIMAACGRPGVKSWAFGLGIDRLAMILFDIPDIRLLWTDDPRFTKQFESGKVVKFEPYSKYPPVHKDIAFWLPEGWDGWVESWMEPEWEGYNDLCQLVREEAGDLVESITFIDEYITRDTPARTSHCYRITYRSMDRTLLADEVNVIQEKVRERVGEELGVTVR